ncbi:MAG: transposase [Candidatus Azambacteria bacterium]|nr:transposase [Candidatus Azambacteria bacterium]
MPQTKPAGLAGSRKNNKYTPQFKLDRALEALRTDNVAEIARKYDLNANLLYLWRGQLIERGTQVFETTPDQIAGELKTKVGRLEQMLGKKEVELNLLKNFSDFYSSRNTP